MGVGLQIYLDHKVASSMCLRLFFCSLLFKLCSSSDSVGVGLQIYLDHEVASMGLFFCSFGEAVLVK